MDRDEEIRRNAAEAQKWADQAKNDRDRESWLRVAQSWLSLLRKRQQRAADAFEGQVKALGTGQDDSHQSH